MLDSRVGGVRRDPALRDRWRRGKRGWPASYPIAQLPNAALSVALAGLLVAAVTGGSAHASARAVFYAGLSAWAWGELASGVNPVRRALGAAGLGYVVARVVTAVSG
jgi:hypothetical protein